MMESEIFEKIFNIFGPMHQAEKLKEEIRELFFAFQDIENGLSKDYIGYQKELADVFILLSQFYFNDSSFEKIVLQKLTRTIDRIESGYYDTLENQSEDKELRS